MIILTNRANVPLKVVCQERPAARCLPADLHSRKMPLIFLELVMALLVLVLFALVFMGLRNSQLLPELTIPRPRLPEFDFRQFLPQPDHSRQKWVEDPEGLAAQRARELAQSRKDQGQAAEAPAMPETFLDEAMRNLEHAFESFEAGRIGADTYRSLVQTVRRAAGRRRAGLAARDEVLGPGDNQESSELSQAIAAVDAAQWCLDWIDEFEQLQVSARSLFKPPQMALKAYS